MGNEEKPIKNQDIAVDKKISKPGVSLAEILAQSPSLEERKNVQNAHRVQVITLVASIDDGLQRLLAVTLTPSTHDQDALLDEGKVIGTLGLRAKLCTRMGLISPALYQLIKELSNIRNDCSHKPTDFNVFDDQSTRDKINNYWNRLNPKLFNPQITKTEERFKEICSYVNTMLTIVANETPSKNFLDNEILFRK